MGDGVGQKSAESEEEEEEEEEEHRAPGGKERCGEGSRCESPGSGAAQVREWSGWGWHGAARGGRMGGGFRTGVVSDSFPETWKHFQTVRSPFSFCFPKH